MPKTTDSNSICSGGFSGFSGRKAASSHQGWKFGGSREKSPHGQFGQSRETSFWEVASDDGSGALGTAGAGATMLELMLFSTPKTVRQSSPVMMTATQKTSGAEHFMLSGENVLASIGAVSKVFATIGIIGVSPRTATKSTIGIIDRSGLSGPEFRARSFYLIGARTE